MGKREAIRKQTETIEKKPRQKPKKNKHRQKKRLCIEFIILMINIEYSIRYKVIKDQCH
jgi:hypothetical protein